MKFNTIRGRLMGIFLLVLLVSGTYAQIPAGYYDDASGKTGYTLKTSLYNIIKDHNSQDYNGLWTVFKTSDVRTEDGKVWDMYSNCSFTFDDDKDNGTGGTTECEFYNREHSFPKSWFNDASPMYTDAFHIVPTDKKVNAERGNLPYGEVGTVTYTSSNGSKVGACNYPGYTGTVFEPIDEYKGDFARGYFYMATRYEDIIASWETNNENGDAMLNGTSDQVFEDWALEMLIAWHNADPVSQKEIDRNDAVYNFQGNRNPFIDHPEYVASIWESTTTSPTLTVDASLTDFGSVEFGSVSASQTYTVSGTDLTDDILIEASSGFEVSLADLDADYSSSVTLSQSGGTVASATIYVRFKPASNSNGDATGTITHTTTGANTETINVSGSETIDEDTPAILVEASLTDFGTVAFGAASSVQTYTVSGTDLTDDILIEASSGFEVSLADVDADFVTSLTLSQSGGSVSSTTIFVRFKPVEDSNNTVTGSITHSSLGATTQVITVSGNEEAEFIIPTINFSFSTRTIDPVNQYEVQLYVDQAPNVDVVVHISQIDVVNLVYNETYTTEPEMVNGTISLTWPLGELNATFLISFDTELLNEANPGSLEFALVEDNAYTIGGNNSFQLNLRGEGVVSGIRKDRNTGVYIYPNPVKRYIKVGGVKKWHSYCVMDLMGKSLLKGALEANRVIDVSVLKPGPYFLQLIASENRATKKIIVE